MHSIQRVILACTVLTMLCGTQGRASDSVPDPARVSIYQLIATPERFDGKLVKAVGFCRLDFEGEVLYPHQEDYEANLTANAIRLVPSETVLAKSQTLSGRYVTVVGRFRAMRSKKIQAYAGRMEAVTSIEPLSARLKPQ